MIGHVVMPKLVFVFQILLPANIGWMSVMNHDTPLLSGQHFGFDSRDLSGFDNRSGSSSAIGIGAGVRVTARKSLEIYAIEAGLRSTL